MALTWLSRALGALAPPGTHTGVSFQFGSRFLAAAPQHPVVTGHPRAADGGPLCTFLLEPVPHAAGVYSIKSCASGKFLRLHNPMQERAGVADLNGDSVDDVGTLIRLNILADGSFTLSSALLEDTYLAVGGEPWHIGTAVPAHSATAFRIVTAKVPPAEAALKLKFIQAALGGATPVTEMRGGGEAGAVAPPLGVPPFSMTAAQTERFVKEGYLVVPGILPRPAVDAALRQIHHSFGLGYDVAGGKVIWKDGLEADPAILRLFSHTQALPAAEALLGRGCVQIPSHGQVAPRFPQALPEPVRTSLVSSLYAPLPGGAAPKTALEYFARCGDRQAQAPHSGWHTDGMDSDRVAPFTLLICMVLSDTTEDNCGQFTVYPGGHHELAAIIRREGAGFITAHASRPPLAAPEVQVRARAGDVIFAHPMLPHKVGINYSPHIRHAVFFRLMHRSQMALREHISSDLFVLFDGVKEVLGGAGTAAGAAVARGKG
jgi:hypothetical protein